MTTDRDRPAPTLSVPAEAGAVPVEAPEASVVEASVVEASLVDAPPVDGGSGGVQADDVRTVDVRTVDVRTVDEQTGARLAELATRTNLGALDTLLAIAAHAGAAAGRNVEAAATARRLGRRMTTSMAQLRIATAPR